MKHKVLIADDSLTIQKVIRITLSGEPYDLIDCDDSTSLFNKVENERPALVYLDFTLDEGISGYEICKKILTISPDTKVMMMFGTFDSVDEDLYNKSGASGKITKPFDGQKFITLTTQLLEGQSFFGVEADDHSLEAVEKHLEEVNDELSPEAETSSTQDDDYFEIEEDEVDDLDWQVQDKTAVLDASEVQANLSDHDSGEYDYQALIADELKEWGMSVPSEIEGYEPEPVSLTSEMSEKVKEMAAITDVYGAEDEDEIELLEDVVEDDIIESKEDIDEDYPEVLEVASDDIEEDDEHDDSTFSFSENEDGELEADELIDFADKDNEDKFSMLESQLESELDEDGIWDADETEDDGEDIDLDRIEEVASATAVESAVEHIQENDLHQSVEESVKKYMEEHGRSIIEKIAWEMIPDLAENIIRQEVKDLAGKVLSEDNS